jgi:uncharacterized protein GlcG (DUF336 family)
MKLDTARKILDAALAAARTHNFKPLTIAVLDARGALKAFAAEDGTSLKRGEIATAKAAGALAMGLGSRTLGTMAAQRPQFVAAVTHAVGGMLIPVAARAISWAQWASPATPPTTTRPRRWPASRPRG